MSLESFVNRFFELEYVTGLVVRRHGETLVEQYRELCGPADRHQLFSLSKSFTSTAFGIARGEGLISLDDHFADFFPEYLSNKVSDRMRSVTMRNLLTMSSGHSECCIIGSMYGKLGDGRHFDNDRPFVQNILETDLPYEPGTRFVYNSGATYLVSAVLQRVTGVGILEYLKPRFFEPIGITGDLVWDRDPQGIELGGWGFNLSPREIAAAAEVWLHYGKGPGGRQLIPEDYMRLATSNQISNGDPAQPSDWSQGYGFQFWQCQHGFFRGDGAAGQLAVMMPKFDTVVAVTAGLCDMQKELNVIWDELVPALESGDYYWTLPPREFAPKFLMGEKGAFNPAFTSSVFEARPNKLGIRTIKVRQLNEGLEIIYKYVNGTEDTIRAGYNSEWRSSLRFVDKKHNFDAYGLARWLSPTVVEVKLALPCSPSFFTLTFDSARNVLHSVNRIWFAQGWNADIEL